jgi:hypothetical protein
MSKIFLILRIIQRDIIINVNTSACEVIAILVGFQRDLNFLDRFLKNNQIDFIKKFSMGAEMFQVKRPADGQT